METEETNTTEETEIHCKDFQIESGNTEARTEEMSVLPKRGQPTLSAMPPMTAGPLNWPNVVMKL